NWEQLSQNSFRDTKRIINTENATMTITGLASWRKDINLFHGSDWDNTSSGATLVQSYPNQTIPPGDSVSIQIEPVSGLEYGLVVGDMHYADDDSTYRVSGAGSPLPIVPALPPVGIVALGLVLAVSGTVIVIRRQDKRAFDSRGSASSDPRH